jgi:hypothetical protein
MRTTVDIPDDTYRELKIKAAREGTTVRQLVIESIELAHRQTPSRKKKKPFAPPLIPSSKPGTLELTNEQIYDLIGFP